MGTGDGHGDSTADPTPTPDPDAATDPDTDSESAPTGAEDDDGHAPSRSPRRSQPRAPEHGAAAPDGYLLRLDYPALGVETVVFRLTVSGSDVERDAVAADLSGPPMTDVYVVAGREDIVAVGRFLSDRALADTIARLSSDPRVGAISVDTVLSAACEYDAEPLLD